MRNQEKPPHAPCLCLLLLPRWTKRRLCTGAVACCAEKEQICGAMLGRARPRRGRPQCSLAQSCSELNSDPRRKRSGPCESSGPPLSRRRSTLLRCEQLRAGQASQRRKGGAKLSGSSGSEPGRANGRVVALASLCAGEAAPRIPVRAGEAVPRSGPGLAQRVQANPRERQARRINVRPTRRRRAPPGAGRGSFDKGATTKIRRAAEALAREERRTFTS